MAADCWGVLPCMIGQANRGSRREIDAVDRRIDRLVYELYDLTDDEIAIVEEGRK